MKRKYRKLSLKDREILWHLRLKGRNYREIGKLLGVSHTTISREVNRNSFRGMAETYLPAYAEEALRIRKHKRGRKKQILNERIRRHVEEKLKLGWSPEQISKTMPEGLNISHESIYKYVYEHKELSRYLPSHKGFRRKRRKKRVKRTEGILRVPIPNRVGIDQRPIEINNRETFGHWEADLVVSSKSFAALSVLVERKTRRVKIQKIESKNSQVTSQAIINQLLCLPPQARQSLTYDNGPEFALHEKVNEVLGTKSFFCQPFHSWEKGSVENMNSLIRRYIPKKTDISPITEDEIQEIENKLNNRPKKCLGYQTPYEVFIQNL